MSNTFDLEPAVAKWRTEMAVTGADPRELEAHLRESLADLQKRGLSVEEAFLIAALRIGTPAALREAVSRENPLALHRERAFWLLSGALGLAVILLLTHFAALVGAAASLAAGMRDEQLATSAFFAGLVAAVLASILVAKSLARMNHPFLPGKSNRRYLFLVMCVVVVILFVNALLLPFMGKMSTPQDFLAIAKINESSTFFAVMFLPLILAAVLAWMLRNFRRAATA